MCGAPPSVRPSGRNLQCSGAPPAAGCRHVFSRAVYLIFPLSATPSSWTSGGGVPQRSHPLPAVWVPAPPRLPSPSPPTPLLLLFKHAPLWLAACLHMGLRSGFEDQSPSSPPLGFQTHCRDASNPRFSSRGGGGLAGWLRTLCFLSCVLYLFMLVLVRNLEIYKFECF